MAGTLDLLADRLASERDLLVRRADSLDNTIGIVLGFASALATFADLEPTIPSRVAIVLAIFSALTSLAALTLQPIVYMSIDRTRLEDLEVSLAVARRELFEVEARRCVLVERELDRKSRLFRLGASLLVPRSRSRPEVIVGSGGD